MHSASLPLLLSAAGMSSVGMIPGPQHTNLSPDQINWKWNNQRQVRKNRRRAHAAGCKKAFA